MAYDMEDYNKGRNSLNPPRQDAPASEKAGYRTTQDGKAIRAFGDRLAKNYPLGGSTTPNVTPVVSSGARLSKRALRRIEEKVERERKEAERKWKNSKQGRKEEAARLAAAEAEQRRQREKAARIAAAEAGQRRQGEEAARLAEAEQRRQREEAARIAAVAEERRLAARTPAEVEADRRVALAKAEQDRREAAARAESERREAIAREEAVQRRNIERAKAHSTFIGTILDLGVDEYPDSFTKRIAYRSLMGAVIIAGVPFAAVPTWYNEIGNTLLEKKPFKTKTRAKIARAAIKMAKPFVVAGSFFGVINGAFFQHNPIEAGAYAYVAVDKSVSAVGNLFAEKDQVTSLGGKIAEKVISVPIGAASFIGASAGNLVGTAVDYVVFKPVGWAFSKAADSMVGDSSPPPATSWTAPQTPQLPVKMSYSVKNTSQSLG